MQQQDISVMVHTAGIDTGGAWSLVEITLARYAVGPPLHVHHHTREEVTVLDGVLLMSSCDIGCPGQPGQSSRCNVVQHWSDITGQMYSR